MGVQACSAVRERGRAAPSSLLSEGGVVSLTELLAKQESRSQEEEFSKDYFRK